MNENDDYDNDDSDYDEMKMMKNVVLLVLLLLLMMMTTTKMMVVMMMMIAKTTTTTTITLVKEDTVLFKYSHIYNTSGRREYACCRISLPCIAVVLTGAFVANHSKYRSLFQTDWTVDG